MAKQVALMRNTTATLNDLSRYNRARHTGSRNNGVVHCLDGVQKPIADKLSPDFLSYPPSQRTG